MLPAAAIVDAQRGRVQRRLISQFGQSGSTRAGTETASLDLLCSRHIFLRRL
jgi:hypothetical protein